MKRKDTKELTRTVLFAILCALIIIMSFTPLGYLKLGAVEITFIVIPVAVGAILLGERYGFLLGCVFGITSFIQCFGQSPFGVALMSINPLSTLLICLFPRAICGYLTGIISRLLLKKEKINKYFSITLSSILAAVFNTLFFTLFFVVFFRNADIASLGMNLSQKTILDVILVIITTNSLIEIVACGFFGSAFSSVAVRFIPQFKKNDNK